MNDEELINILYAVHIGQRRILDLLYSILGHLDESDAKKLLELHSAGKLWGPDISMVIDDTPDAPPDRTET